MTPNTMTDQLPILSHIPDIREALLTHKKAVVAAAPGAGKTTLVPLKLLEEPYLEGKTILMLEPRRLAARMAAMRMADLLGEQPAQTVGYQIRHERVAGPSTRIIVMTEGILTRKIQNDPELSDVGLVIFDEFHERNLHSDLGLALCLEAADVLRPDLRILVMSATLDTAAVAGLLGDAGVIQSDGRSWPVSTVYRQVKRQDRAWGAFERDCAAQVMRALENDEGDILVFLPGAGEIGRVYDLLRQRITSDSISIHPLYGNLTRKDQDAAIQPSPPGCRKIVLATSIAETSLTIEGVRVVVDGGLMRVPRYDSGYAMGRLETVPVSKASADQRRGRAGRLGPGVCYRMWTEDEQALHPEFNTPEILQADLTRLVLELALWGAASPDELKWLDLPPRGAYAQARDFLMKIKALDEKGRITDHGRTLAGLGVHPRLGHMLVLGKDKGKGYLACLIAACLGERDFFMGKDSRERADIRLRLAHLEDVRNGKRPEAGSFAVNQGTVAVVLKNAGILARDLGVKETSFRLDNVGELLALAYPERIAMAAGGAFGSYKMASGTAVTLSESDPLGHERFIVCAELDGQRKRSRVYLAAAYAMEDLETDYAQAVQRQEVLAWDDKTGFVTAEIRHVYDQLVLYTEKMAAPDPESVKALILDEIRKRGLDLLPWTPAHLDLRARSVFLRGVEGVGDFPDLSDETLLETLDQWLGPFLAGVNSLSRLKKIDMEQALSVLLPWSARKRLEDLAPTHLVVPSGSRIPLDYTVVDFRLHQAPVLSVRLQEMFGCVETPKIAGGRVPVTVQLLSPAGRVMQVTKDLESFWKNTYEQVKKDLKGRYPKHYWPDDPYHAVATSRTKKNMDRKP